MPLGFPPNAVPLSAQVGALVAIGSTLFLNLLALRTIWRLPKLGSKLKRLAVLAFAHSAGPYLLFDLSQPVLMVASSVFVSVFAVLVILPPSSYDGPPQPIVPLLVQPRPREQGSPVAVAVVAVSLVIAVFALAAMVHETKSAP